MSRAPVPESQDLEELLQRGFRYALALTHDRHRAEDLLQDAWVAILQRGAPRHVGYLFSTLRNRFVDQERRRRLVAVEPLEAMTDEGDALGFLDEVSQIPETVTLERALGELRPQEREMLFLAAVEGHTVREISDLIARPLGTVSSSIQRARRKIRAFCERARERKTS